MTIQTWVEEKLNSNIRIINFGHSSVIWNYAFKLLLDDNETSEAKKSGEKRKAKRNPVRKKNKINKRFDDGINYKIILERMYTNDEFSYSSKNRLWIICIDSIVIRGIMNDYHLVSTFSKYILTCACEERRLPCLWCTNEYRHNGPLQNRYKRGLL